MNKRKFTFEDWENMENLSGGDYLNEGNLFLYNTSVYNENTGKRENQIWVKNLSTGEEKRITAGGRGENGAKFTPDGKGISFLSSGENGRQVYVYTLADGSIKCLTDIHQPMMDPMISPDGKKLLFACPSAGSAMPDPSEPVAIENLNYKFDGMGFYTPDSYMHLWVYDFEENSLVRISEGNFNYMHHNWMPDSKSVICGSSCFCEVNDALAMDLIKIDLDEKYTCHRLTSCPWMVSYPNPLRPVASPDGKYVYAGFMSEEMDMSDEENQNYPEIYIYKVNSDGSGMKKIFEPSENCFQCVQFPYNAGCGAGFDSLQVSEDGENIYFYAGWNGRGNLYRLNTEGGTAETILTGKKIYRGMSKIRGGKAIITCSEPDVPQAYYLFDTNNADRLEKIYQSNENLIRDTAISPAHDFFFDTLDGEGRVHGWVQEPQNIEHGKKYPAILYVHGGPHPFYTYGFTPEHQCFAAEGFAVIYCNPRGSSGYGLNHQQMSKAFNGMAYMDVLQFVDEACKRYDFIDKDRIGVTGGSYGGYMTNYLATHCQRFKAYITQRSVASELISYATSDMSTSSRKYEHFEEFMLRQVEKSAVAYADKIDKPFLILQGEDDLRTPVEGAHQLFTAIKDCNPELPVKMLIFPHVAHDQPDNPVQHKRYFDEMVNWFKKYL